MRTYDFAKAKRLIEAAENLESASMGMYEDWFWTATTVWEDGKWEHDLTTEPTLGGIKSSDWATPTLRLDFIGEEGCRMVPCFTGEVSGRQKFPIDGELSGPVQNALPSLEAAPERSEAK